MIQTLSSLSRVPPILAAAPPGADFTGWLLAVGFALAAVLVAILSIRAWRRVSRRTRELGTSEERFHGLFDNAAVPILEEDFSEVNRWLDGLRAADVENLGDYLRTHPEEVGRQFQKVRVTAANRRALDMLGATDFEEFEERMHAAGASATPETFALELETLWSGRATLQCETSLRVPGKPLCRCRMHWAMRVRRGVPNPSRVLLTFTDLSQLGVSEERYQRLFEALPTPAWVFDAETFRFLDVNASAVRAHGWNRAEFLGMRVHDIRPPEEVPALVEEVGRQVDDFQRVGIWRHRVRDGRVLEAEVTTRAILIGGRRAIMAIARDVTQHRLAEAALRESEGRFRNLFENAAEGVYESAPEGGFRSVNPAFARMFGYADAAELLALPPAAGRGLYVPQSRREDLMEQIGGSGFVNGFESEARRKDGSTFWMSESVRAVRDASGRIVHLQGFVSDITAGKRAKNALWESEVRYRALFEHSPVAIVELDYGGLSEIFAGLRTAGTADLAAELAGRPELRQSLFARVVPIGLNEAALIALRAASKEDLLSRINELATPEADEMLAHTICTLWSGGSRTEAEFPLRCLDGSLRRFHARWWTTPAGGGGAGYGRAQTALIDVTEMRRTEVALRESEQRFRILFELSPVGIAEYDYRATFAWLDRMRSSGVSDLNAWFDEHPTELSAAMFRIPLVGANAAMLRLTGASTLSELVAQEARLFTPDVFAARRACFLAAWSGRNECEGEVTTRSLDGASRRVYFHWRVPIVEGKPYFERAQIAILDLTEVKSAERNLAAERERLSVTLRAMTEGVVTTDTHGMVQFINEAACAATGWKERGAVGSSIDQICVLRREKTGAPVASPVRAALNGDRAMELPPQSQLVRRDGSACLVEGRCAPMHDTGGRALGAVFVFRDVTERSRLESELLRASKLESVGVLAGGIAHDFNNLLAVVMGNLSVAQLDEGVVARAGKWLKEAERGAQRARDLTQQLLTFAKGGEPIRATVRLQEVVREAAAFATHGAKVRCEFDLAADLRAADADKGQIGQVVQNLVINASQAMPDGGVVRIVLRNDVIGEGQMPLKPGDYLKLSISDTGAGIPPDLLPHIFEPYFTTKKDGTGLGLASVYSIVRKHRGHVTVESQPGHGTTFDIWLPAAVEEAPDSGSSRSPFGPLGGRILFMDDEEGVRIMAAELLGRLGFDVTAVADGALAVQEFEAARAAGRPFRLVMMDLTVPGAMGGLEAMRAILAIDPEVRGIVSSGYSSDPVMANYRQYGFKAMLPKPYRVDQLAKTLRDVMALA